jgi:hypothetical protein
MNLADNRMISHKANDSVASQRRCHKMKFAPDNTLRGLKKSQALVILYRHVEGVQQNSFTMLRIGSEQARQTRYNRYRVTRKSRAKGVGSPQPALNGVLIAEIRAALLRLPRTTPDPISRTFILQLIKTSA